MARRAKHPSTTPLLAACLCIAALFWIKLKLVRNLPRTAYAEPEAVQPVDPAPPQPFPVPATDVAPADADAAPPS